MDTTEQFCFLAGINITAAGVKHGIEMVQPLLGPILTLIQIMIGVVTIYHLTVTKRRKRHKRDDHKDDPGDC